MYVCVCVCVCVYVCVCVQKIIESDDDDVRRSLSFEPSSHPL